jgi:translation initiation factor IF-2
MPEIKPPPKPPKPVEPKAQKPEIRLPKEALTARKGQGRPPLEHLTEKKPKGDRSGRAAPKSLDQAEKTAAAGKRGRKKTTAEPETPGRGLAGMASARADRKARRASRKAKLSVSPSRDEETSAPRRRRTLVHKGTNTAAPRKGKIALELPCTVRGFSEATGVSGLVVLYLTQLEEARAAD